MAQRVAVVTGGTGALGGAVVAALLADGWTLRVPWTSEAGAARLRDAVADSDRLHLVPTDLTDAGSVEAFFGEIDEAHGRLDLVCNLVGGFAAGGLAETDPGTWEHLWTLNATSLFLTARGAVPLLRRSGGGRIVNVTAAAVLGGPVAGMSAYLAAKAAVVSLTRNLAEELAPDGITVNAVAPTIIDTAANRKAMPKASREHWLDPAEIAAVIRFLAGPDAAVVTGNVIALRK